MKRMWLIVLAVVAITVLVTGAGTLALFYDSATNQDNSFAAGTLILAGDRDNGDTVPGPMFYLDAAQGQNDVGVAGAFPDGYWAPGDTKEKVFQIENMGSLDGKLLSVSAALHAGSSSVLVDELRVVVKKEVDGTVVATGPLSEFLAAGGKVFAPPIPILSSELANFIFDVSFDLDADDTHQGGITVVDFSFYAEQLAHNP